MERCGKGHLDPKTIGAPKTIARNHCMNSPPMLCQSVASSMRRARTRRNCVSLMGCWLDQDQGSLPIRPESTQP